MEILKTKSFVTERVKVKPITNAEWDKIKNMSVKNIVNPGDMLKNNDLVLVVCENSADINDIDAKYGVFHENSEQDALIRYWNCTLSYHGIQNTFYWKYNNYTHYIVKIYRPKDGQAYLKPTFADKILIGTPEKDHNYELVYENKELLKKFGLS